MKKAFTLVELLVVVVVIAILMAVTFRIVGVGEEETSRSNTVKRMHALETCISGYFAAFGSYPPVRLHGSRNIFYKVNKQGIQVVDEDPDYGTFNWIKVHAACRSQPVAMNYPFREKDWPVINKTSIQVQKMYSKGKGGLAEVAGTGFDALQTTSQLSSKSEEDAWTHCNLFRFGLMSFLLPRFMIMMEGPDTTIYDKFVQWGENNNVPCKFEDGVPYEKWEDIAKQVKPPSPNSDDINDELWKVALLPSQIITARWIACLEGICNLQNPNRKKGDKPYLNVWGVNIAAEDSQSGLTQAGLTTQINNPWRYPPIFSSGDLQSEDNGWTQAYALDGISCVDGWGEEFYYYSPSPHQSYRLWSAGKNRKTFPPWITEKEIDELNASWASEARLWKSDDIVHMSH